MRTAWFFCASSTPPNSRQKRLFETRTCKPIQARILTGSRFREAFLPLRALFSSESSLRYHRNNCETNGLAAMDAFRKSPLGVLLVDPPRIKR